MTQVNTKPDAKKPSASKQILIDLDQIDLGGVVSDRGGIADWIPHRYELALLDSIVWTDEGFTRGVARWDVRADEFWVRGHFPQQAMLPGVLMIEAAAQLACYLFNRRFERTEPAAFLRIDDAVFRRSVEPGQTLYLLCTEVKCSQRRFITAIQGVVEGQIAFEAKIHGMNLGGRRS